MSKSLFKRIGTSVVALSLVISSLSAVTIRCMERKWPVQL